MLFRSTLEALLTALRRQAALTYGFDLPFVLAGNGSDDLLAGNPTLARSIANRFAYLDPLHVLQVDMLRRYRAGDDDPDVARALELTINAIATGLRNSG